MSPPHHELHAVSSLLAEQREGLRLSAEEALRALLREVELARVALQARGLPLSEVDRLPAAQRAAGEHAAALFQTANENLKTLDATIAVVEGARREAAA